MSDSGLKYLHKISTEEIKNGKKVTHEEKIVEGTKGFTAKYFHKEGNKSNKTIVLSKDSGKYLLKVNVNGEPKEMTLTKDELLSELKKRKELKYIHDYVKESKSLR